MVQWIVRLLLVISGSIASWFVARDALNFAVVQMVIAVLLFTVVIFIAAFWSTIKNWFIHKDQGMKQHAPGFLALVTESKKHIKEITPQVLKAKMDQHEPMHLIDVREDNEWDNGTIPTAIHLGRGIIERDIEKKIPDLDQQIVVYCSGGFRCALVAESLQKMGYTQVYSLDTGLQGWIDAGYPVEKQTG